MCFHPFLRITAAGYAEDYIAETCKCQIIDAGNCIGQIHVFKVSAILKRIATDGRQPLREFDTLKACAVLERSAANHLQAAVLRKLNGGQLAAPAECVCRQLRHALANNHFRDHTAIAVPRNIAFSRVCSHAPRTRECQNAIAAQRPVHIAAAFARSNLRRFTLHICNTLGNCPIFGITIISNTQYHIFGARKGVCHN